ncbi:zinc-ribbon-domain-containing protein [Gaertneriomyces semiglobifer]|nr:zinc-ribbon-domain-containing protein [Gaertneriomyces semiglobifer]
MQSTRVTNRLANRRRDFDEVTDTDRQPTYYDKAGGILGCKHYQRASKLQAHCCGKWDTCRFCHDEVSDHNIVRNLITTMMCMYCGTVQPAGQDCINTACKRRVSKYYCKECKLWDSDPRKNIYHCYDCGICRIGKGLGIDYFHCKKCNVCMAISLRGRHKCIERNLESDCPICGEYMFTSTTTVIFMPCGHCIHYKCHQEYIQTSYQCPTCLKSLADMTDYFQRIDAALAQQQMPQEYENLYNQIYCNDCEKKCFAKFHFMYHKCTSCKGYNTKVLHTLDKCQVPTDQLRLVEDAAVSPNAATPTTAVNPEPPALDEQRRRSRSGSMVQRNVAYFCHQCQSSTHPVMVAGSQRCGTCDSDFLEQL